MAQAAASGEIAQDLRDLIEEEFKDYVGNNIGAIITTGGDLAEGLLALLGEAVVAVLGTVVAAAVFVLYDIWSSSADDYYGTEVFALALPTNITDFVDVLPGVPINGGRRLNTQTLEFFGHTQYPEATSVDGIVDVHFHFEFTNKGVWSPTA